MSATNRVGRRRPQDLARNELRFGCLARTRRADREDCDEVIRFDQAGPDRGSHAQRDRGHVAPRHGDALHTDQVVALCAAGFQREFRQTVRPGAEVVTAVELRPCRRVGEPVIGSAVDDEGRGIQLGRQLAGLAVRQGEEDDVVAGEVFGSRIDEHEVGERPEVGLHARQRLAGVRERRDGCHVELRMGCEQPQHLTAGISAGACNGDGVVHDSWAFMAGP